ncbi:MAG: SDR family oxidoreductase [Elusimicrobiota bacterium]|jgi:NAD(P)-dependent dehydrogenase (short-subunit alcohol dehydrogenase family)
MTEIGTTSRPFQGTGYWALILGGSSGFGLAAAKRLARAGMNILIGHKDTEGSVETLLKPHFDEIRAQGVQLRTHNVNLFEEDGRGEVFESVAQNAGPGKVHLFMHSVAAGACKLIIEDRAPDFKAAGLQGLAAALHQEGVAVSQETLRKAVNHAFHEGRCDALHTLADSRIAYREDLLAEADLQRTVWMMGYDYMLWGRELAKEGLLTRTARLVALTSEGNAVSWKGYAAVSAAKCGLEACAKAMAVELGPYGVRSFVLQPGITDTPAGNAIPNFDLMKAEARIRNPSHRLTTPEDVAEVLCGMCLPGFDWVNGAVIRVDGGEAVAG